MKATIVIRTYNRDTYLRECLNSISCQTSKEWELLIFDDGKEGYKIFNEFRNKNPLNRIVYLSSLRDFHLFNRAWNYSITLSEADVVIRIDDDDLLHPDAVKIITETYKQYPTLDFTIGSTILFDENNKLAYNVSILPKNLPYTHAEWLPYALSEGRTTSLARDWDMNFYDTPQPFSSIVHASRYNISIVYGLYTMRVESLRDAVRSFQPKYRKGEDLEFFGILDYKGFTYSTFKKGLHFTRSYRSYNRITNEMYPEDTELVRDRADEFRNAFHRSTTIDITGEGSKKDTLDAEYHSFFYNFKKQVEGII